MATKPESSQKWGNACRIWFCPENELISNELRNMAQSQRELVWADLSGNKKTTVQYEHEGQMETPANICSAMDQLQQEIMKQPSFTTLRKVHEQYPTYVNSEEFQLKFLRVERFEPKNAVLRMFRYFEEKKALFGGDTLGRDIVFSDLGEREIQCLREGGAQFLSKQDKGGRRILFIHRSCIKYQKHKDYIRSMWYLCMDAVKDPETQKLGIVRVIHMLEKGVTHDADFYKCLVRFYNAIPLKVVATYVESPPSILDGPINSWLSVTSAHARVRTRLLTGSRQECLYHLACLGVPSDNVPLNNDGTPELDAHHEWLQRCEEAEGSRKRARRGHDDSGNTSGLIRNSKQGVS